MAAFTGAKILILDNDEDILFLCEVICQELGLDVIKSNTSYTIIQQVEMVRPDIILIDNWLLGPGGLAAIKELKAHKSCRYIPIILFSTNSHIESLGKQSDADVIIKKPFDIWDMENAIIALLKHQPI